MDTYANMPDYDFNLDKILLVHKNTFVPGFRWNEYKNGRKIDGFVLCASGSALFRFEDGEITLNRGQAMFLSSESRYVLENCGSVNNVHYTVNFEKLTGYGASDAMYEILTGKRHFVSSVKHEDELLELFGRLLSVWQSRAGGYRLAAKSLIYELLYLYMQDCAHEIVGRDSYHRLKPAKQVLDARYTEALRADDLAGLCGMSQTHFRRLFRSTFGCPPMEYKQRKQIERAKDLLLTGLYSVSETACQAGFGDMNYFARVFRKTTGYSPSEYRRLSVYYTG